MERNRLNSFKLGAQNDHQSVSVHSKVAKIFAGTVHSERR